MEIAMVLRTLASERRLPILVWFRDPGAHFPPQVDGDLVRDGISAVLTARKLEVTRTTLSQHMRVLSPATLVRSKRVKQWTFYLRNEAAIRRCKELIRKAVPTGGFQGFGPWWGTGQSPPQSHCKILRVRVEDDERTSGLLRLKLELV
jgi:hypothetical protein